MPREIDTSPQFEGATYVSPTELIRSFMEFALKRGKTDFPLLYGWTQPWHEFFYTLDRFTKGREDRFPELRRIRDFNWDREYPTVKVWDEIQGSFGILRVCGMVGGGNRTLMYPDRIRPENPLEKSNPELLEIMLQVAMGTNNFFVPE